MYDLDKLVNFPRYGVVGENLQCLLDFSKSATCEVIVRNPFIDAARREIDATSQNDDLRKGSPINYSRSAITITSTAQHRPATIIASSAPQQPSPITVANTTSTAAVRPPRATCSFCAKSFSHLGDYNKHRRRHTGERPYACDSCPRRFAHASNLQRHRRLHSGEKPFECVTCAKRFSRKDKLAAHVARRCCKPSV